MTPRTLLKGASLALALTLFTSLPALSQQLRTTLEDLSSVSEAVVLAKTMKMESFWNEDQTAILTRVTLQVEDQISGQMTSTAEVIVPGGQIGNVIHEVSDMPLFQQDEEAIVFMERHQSGIFVVSGGQHGMLPVSRDRDSGVQMVSGATSLFEVESSSEETSTDVRPDDDTMPLDVFKTRFKAREK